MECSCRSFFVALALLAGGACDSNDGPEKLPPDCPDFAVCLFAGEGYWVQGDTHVHTEESTDNATGTPADYKAVALERGLEFVILTDHSAATGSHDYCRDASVPNDCIELPEYHNLGPEFPWTEEARAVSEPDRFLMACGNEISPVDMEGLTARGHVGVYPLDPDDFDTSGVIVDRPSGEVSGGAGVEEALRRGAFAVVNHPYSPNRVARWIEYDWTSFAYGGMEVYNYGGRFDDGDLRAINAWLCDIVLGRAVAPVGASDVHRHADELPGVGPLYFDPGLGGARTSVFVTELSWPALEAAYESGRTIAHDGDNLLDFRVHDGDSEIGMLGDDITVAAGSELRVVYRGLSQQEGEVVFYAASPGDCIDHRGESPPGEVEIVRRELFRAPIPGASTEDPPAYHEGEFTLTADSELVFYGFYERPFAPIGNLDAVITGATRIALQSED